MLLCWLPRDLKCIFLSTLSQNNRFLHDNQKESTVACKIVRSVFYQQCSDAACALGSPLPNPACSYGLEVRWQGMNSKDSKSRWETLQRAPLNTTAGSFNTVNTVHPRPIGPKKVSVLNSSSWLAGIVYASNPWSLRQSLVKSSCRRCLWGFEALYAGVAVPLFLRCFSISMGCPYLLKQYIPRRQPCVDLAHQKRP